jgi:hypothetical protein
MTEQSCSITIEVHFQIENQLKTSLKPVCPSIYGYSDVHIDRYIAHSLVCTSMKNSTSVFSNKHVLARSYDCMCIQYGYERVKIVVILAGKTVSNLV